MVIDVFRAFTSAAYAVAAGAREIVLVATVDEAFALRAADPTCFLTGEVDGRPVPGFDAGNSPATIAQLDLRDRRVVQRSSSGTQGVIAAVNAGRILLGSLVTAAATVRLLGDDEVTLVAMGDAGVVPCPEDELCSAYLEALIRGDAVDPARLVRQLRLDDRRWPDWFPRADADLACVVDRFDFGLEVAREDGLLIARARRRDDLDRYLRP